MTDTLPPIATLVPHGGPMCLLDRLISVDGERLIAEVVVRDGGMFNRDGVEGSWVGIEYMAQAIAAWAGWQARQAGHAPRIGFLLGTRRYRSSVSQFVAGQCLRIEIEREYQADNGLGQFQCRVRSGDSELASAQVTVYGPEDPTAFLKGEIS